MGSHKAKASNNKLKTIVITRVMK